ncbi:hypothetical protein V2A60_007591 [Cordyceps javanica]|uniref:C6 transcription factor n=1 Tax=Cordyceps javanica TaxID=43265 RepID=A0A545VAF0_9HYPO|nr:C6 transcription factor [Cordyceps javanica]TQW09912.1 C6 transcription factor [Cordyceps javanica]
MHLSTIHPEGKKYLNIANWLMPRSISLFRQSLSKPLTKNHAEAIVGAALLINYISWFDLSFLHDNVNAIDALAQDPLLLASSGITHAWFQTIPILIEGNSIFLKVMTRHPRLVIERFLARRDSSTNLFAQPLMDIWDDSRYQASSSVVTSTAVHEPANSLAWRLLQGLEREVLPAVAQQEQAMPPYNESERLQQYKEGITKITNTSISTDCQPATPEITPSSQARASFAYVVRRMSPLLHCQTLSSGLDLDIRNDLAAIQDDIEQLIYGFPILCCGPFTNLVQKRDTRALVLLLHLFRSALILLDTERCWWARTRAVTMGQLINSELKLRGLDTHVDKLHASNASFLSE